MGGERKERKGSSTDQVKKNTSYGSFRSIFMHADGVDKFLMALGFIGAVGDGFTTPLVLFVTSKLMNNVGDAATATVDMFTHNINKVLIFFSYLFFHS